MNSTFFESSQTKLASFSGEEFYVYIGRIGFVKYQSDMFAASEDEYQSHVIYKHGSAYCHVLNDPENDTQWTACGGRVSLEKEILNYIGSMICPEEDGETINIFPEPEKSSLIRI